MGPVTWRRTTSEPPATLTDRERKFAEAWAADPEHNGTHAARAAGYKGEAPTLGVTASRLLRKPNVAAYIAELRSEAIAKVEDERQGTVATLAEALQHATGVMRLDVSRVLGRDGEVDLKKLEELPEIERRALAIEVQSTTDADGQVFARHKLKRDPVAVQAAKLIVDHYEGAKKPEGGNTYVLNLNGIDHETLRKLYAAGWLNGEAKRLEQ